MSGRKTIAALLAALLLLTLSGCGRQAIDGDSTADVQKKTVEAVPDEETDRPVPQEEATEAPETPEAPESPAQPDAPPAPEPSDPQAARPPETPPDGPEPKQAACTVSISCGTILQNLDQLTPGKEPLVPLDGWLLRERTVPINTGESAFDLLLRVCREERIHMEYTDTPVYGSAYIEGIANLYEQDCGPLSGWMYKVNGWFPNYGCSRYVLQDGDQVCWVYTCDLGQDVGGPVPES